MRLFKCKVKIQSLDSTTHMARTSDNLCREASTGGAARQKLSWTVPRTPSSSLVSGKLGFSGGGVMRRRHG